MDLEGIVCKRKDSPYKVTEKPSRYWIKVKNSRYSQLEGREELFERVWDQMRTDRGKNPKVTSTVWRYYVERRDKPACCRGWKSPTGKEQRIHPGLESSGRHREVSFEA